jgi:hypothetical protein
LSLAGSLRRQSLFGCDDCPLAGFCGEDGGLAVAIVSKSPELMASPQLEQKRAISGREEAQDLHRNMAMPKEQPSMVDDDTSAERSS